MPKSFVNLGNTLCEGGHYEQARQAFETAIGLKDASAEAYNGLAVAHLHLGRVIDSISAAERAIGLRPDYAEAHNTLGNARKDLGQFERAVAAYNDAIRCKPDYAAAYSSLLMCQLYRSDLPPEAILAETRRFAARFEQMAA